MLTLDHGPTTCHADHEHKLILAWCEQSTTSTGWRQRTRSTGTRQKACGWGDGSEQGTPTPATFLWTLEHREQRQYMVEEISDLAEERLISLPRDKCGSCFISVMEVASPNYCSMSYEQLYCKACRYHQNKCCPCQPGAGQGATPQKGASREGWRRKPPAGSKGRHHSGLPLHLYSASALRVNRP